MKDNTITTTTVVDNSEFEIIFWKVFHNQYLLYHILKQVCETELIPTNLKFKPVKRKKFKDITSLRWIVLNDQYELLNCKLEAGEEVELCFSGLQHMFNLNDSYYHYKIKNRFSFWKKYISNQNYYLDGESIDQFKIKLEQMKLNSEIKKKSLQLILKYKSDEILKSTTLDPLSILLSKNSCMGTDTKNIKFKPNLELVHVFSSEPYNYKITPLLLKGLIKARDYKHRATNLEFILNNPQYVPKKLCVSQYKGEKLPKQTKDGLLLINLYDFLTIKSSSVQIRILDEQVNQLLKLNLKETGITIINADTGVKDIDRLKDIYRQYLAKYKTNNKFKHDNIPEIYQNYLVQFDEAIEGFDENRVMEYTLGYSSANTMKYIVSTESALEYLTRYHNNYRHYKYQIKKRAFPISNEFIKYYTMDRFYNCYQNDYSDSEICKYILSFIESGDMNSYKLAMGSFSFEHGLFNSSNFPISLWSVLKSLKSVIPKQLLIVDTQTIDWLNNHLSSILSIYKQVYKGYNEIGIFKFGSIELIEYLKLNAPYLLNESLTLESGETVGNQMVYSNILSWAINNCDLNTLKYLNNGQVSYKFQQFDKIKFTTTISTIDKLIGKSIKSFKLDNDKGNPSIKTEMKIKFTNQSTSNLILLLEYLNEIEYNFFTPGLFKEFIGCIANAGGSSSGSGDKIDLSKLTNINFNHFRNESIQLYIESITNIKSPNTLKLLLVNEFNAFTSPVKFNQEWKMNSANKKDPTFYGLHLEYENTYSDIQSFDQSCLYYLAGGNMHRHCCTSGESLNEIIKSIELLLDQYSIDIGNGVIIGGSYDSLLSDTYQTMLNYLFKRLIKVHQVSIGKVYYTYNLISSKWKNGKFQFEHSLYHIYFYLGIKSSKLIRFIFGQVPTMFIYFNRPPQSRIYEEASSQYEDTTTYFGGAGDGDVLKHLDPNVYTFEYIMNTPFAQLLDGLIRDILFAPIFSNDISDGTFRVRTTNRPLNSFFKDVYSKSLTKSIENLIAFKQVDLLFQLLEAIQVQLGDSNLVIGEFPTVGTLAELQVNNENSIIGFYDNLKPLTNGRFIYFMPKIIKIAMSNLDYHSFYKLCKYCSYRSIAYISIENINQPPINNNFNLFKQLIDYIEINPVH